MIDDEENVNGVCYLILSVMIDHGDVYVWMVTLIYAFDDEDRPMMIDDYHVDVACDHQRNGLDVDQMMFLAFDHSLPDVVCFAFHHHDVHYGLVVLFVMVMVIGYVRVMLSL